ncbi:MAG: hypothetical protein WC702_00930 [Patescibacteria group bacterium]|jgi:hypothetical protein
MLLFDCLTSCLSTLAFRAVGCEETRPLVINFHLTAKEEARLAMLQILLPHGTSENEVIIEALRRFCQKVRSGQARIDLILASDEPFFLKTIKLGKFWRGKLDKVMAELHLPDDRAAAMRIVINNIDL